jgi:hypothetical protein
MSGRTLVSALVLVMLAAPAAASAKGVQDARACGASECVEALTQDTYLVFEGGPTAGPPTEREPFYELRYRVMAGDGPEPELVPVRVLFVPSEGLIRGEEGTWMHADSRASEALRRHLAGVEPFPAAKLSLASRQAASDPKPGPMDLRTPGEDSGARADAGGIDAAPAIGAGVALALLAAGAAVAVGSRRRRGPAAG